MRPDLRRPVDLWDEDFDEMAESVHTYILNFLEEDVEYSEIEDDRREVETGYRYSGEDLNFKFSLAGPVNSDPEILREGKREIVLQAEEESEVYRELLKDLEKRTESFTEKEYGGLEVSMFEVKMPYG